jgi:hypothetical protein
MKGEDVLSVQLGCQLRRRTISCEGQNKQYLHIVDMVMDDIGGSIVLVEFPVSVVFNGYSKAYHYAEVVLVI